MDDDLELLLKELLTRYLSGELPLSVVDSSSSDPWESLAGVFAGGAIALLGAALTILVNWKMNTRARKNALIDRKFTEGQKDARITLGLIADIRMTSIEWKQPRQDRSFALDPKQVREARSVGQLIADEQVKKAVDRALRILDALRPVAEKLDQEPYKVQRQLIADVESVLQSYIREGDLPPRALARIDDCFDRVNAAWNELDKAGLTYPA